MADDKDAWSKFGKAVAVFAGTPFLIFGGAFLGAFPIMISVGIWHSEIDSRVPALGFWPILGPSWGIGSLITKFRAKYDFSGKGNSK